jgi:hypothetical protein
MTAHAIANLYRPSRNNRMGPASQVCSVPPAGVALEGKGPLTSRNLAIWWSKKPSYWRSCGGFESCPTATRSSY